MSDLFWGFLLCYVTMFFGSLLEHLDYKRDMKLLEKQKEVKKR